MTDIPPGLLEPFRARPERAAVLVDFDGTLAPIVEHADQARPLPGAGATLAALAGHYAVVAVVSGRPVAYLQRHLPARVALHGVYGLESAVGGEVRPHPDAAAWRPVVAEVVAAARAAGNPALEVEDKGLSITLHYRTHPRDAGAARAWAIQQAEATGLRVQEAKMSVELQPPVQISKGTTVEALVGGLDAACFVGDDLGDLPAFDALDRLAARGATTLRVAVATSESVPEMVRRADLVVDGPQGAVAFLQALLPEVGG